MKSGSAEVIDAAEPCAVDVGERIRPRLPPCAATQQRVCRRPEVGLAVFMKCTDGHFARVCDGRGA